MHMRIARSRHPQLRVLECAGPLPTPQRMPQLRRRRFDIETTPSEPPFFSASYYPQGRLGIIHYSKHEADW